MFAQNKKSSNLDMFPPRENRQQVKLGSRESSQGANTPATASLTRLEKKALHSQFYHLRRDLEDLCIANGEVWPDGNAKFPPAYRHRERSVPKLKNQIINLTQFLTVARSVSSSIAVNPETGHSDKP